MFTIYHGLIFVGMFVLGFAVGHAVGKICGRDEVLDDIERGMRDRGDRS